LRLPLGTRGRKRLTEDAVGEVLRRLKQRAGVKGPVNPHAFRHGFAREWLRNGGDIAVLSKVLGHADPSTTMRSYAVLRAGELHHFHRQYSPVARLKLAAQPGAAAGRRRA
jgi:integrase/recombinase XerD